ncbi:hypothetical protein NIES3974_10770 [Calothrix sp. NIES-3974]|nr:hypothetical protein NIES3974_10770 [Calothrix sp. NIES-3974]
MFISTSLPYHLLYPLFSPTIYFRTTVIYNLKSEPMKVVFPHSLHPIF